MLKFKRKTKKKITFDTPSSVYTDPICFDIAAEI